MAKWSPPSWLLEADLYVAIIACTGFIFISVARFSVFPLGVWILALSLLFWQFLGGFALAQSIHFGWGLALVTGVVFLHSPLWLVPALLAAELVLKEGVFDQMVEGNPLVWNGLTDWSFYVLGSASGFLLLHVW